MTSSLTYYELPDGDSFYPAKRLWEAVRSDLRGEPIFRTPEECAAWVRSLGDDELCRWANYYHGGSVRPVGKPVVTVEDREYDGYHHPGAAVTISATFERRKRTVTTRRETVAVDGKVYSRDVEDETWSEWARDAEPTTREVRFPAETVVFVEPKHYADGAQR